MTFRFLLAAALLWPLAGQAQDASAVRAAKDHFQATARVATADLADLSVTDSYLDRRSGATMVYLAQRVNGVEVYGTVTASAVAPSGEVFAAGDAFQADLAARANAPAPALGASAALAAAELEARAWTDALVAERALEGPRSLSDDPATDAVVAAPRPVVYRTAGEPALVYQPVAGGALRLAWAVTIEGDGGPTGQQLWAARVDAQTGAVLALDDLVVHDTFHDDAFARHEAHGHGAHAVDLAPVAAAQPALGGTLGTYRVVPIPFESPNHGPFTTVVDPSLDGGDASPFGWHDTNGADGAESTLTTGNNVDAYLDADGNNVPDAGSQPDGGPGLVFDAEFDPALTPLENADAAVTNTFYWSNITHDVLWHYGFDEPSGNFQVNNYGRGGNGNDPVRAEVLDDAGDPDGERNNANFSTPSDGSRPRMQMYEWNGVPSFDVIEPAEIAGRYPSAGAAFGQTTPGVVTAEAFVSLTEEEEISRGCTAADVNAPDGDVTGKIALIQRGDCNFVDKARAAQERGAVGAVVYNCVPGSEGCSTNSPGEGLVTMACPDGESCADVTIAVTFVQQSTGDVLAGAASTPTVSLEIPQARDSDFDAGVIAHEIGHGVSNRLTGGPSAAGCLGGEEQMGEGWSDYIGMILTMQADDTSTTPRGVGTYLEFEDTDGLGIRPAVYTTDFAVNDYTYQDVISGAGTTLSIPHGVGFVWATVLWDMTWALIDQDGFGDIYDADGGAGNQKALQLVMQAMKLQPCNPGFVTGRDAIFEADALLYGSANSDLIAATFAARGLGLNADQGTVGSATDGTADFTAFPPFEVATETDADGRTTSLVVSGANPFRSATTLTLDVEAAQAVTVDVVDLLGRRVATLFDGELAAGASQALTVSGDDLPSGVYLVRAVGETFSLTERVTLAR